MTVQEENLHAGGKKVYMQAGRKSTCRRELMGNNEFSWSDLRPATES